MQTSTEHVRLRVLVENVTSSDVAIPKGDYDGYIDWEHPDDTEPRMMSVQLIPDSTISSLLACRGAGEFICCQGEHGSEGAKRYLIGVSAPSAFAGFGRVRPLEQLLLGIRPRWGAGSRGRH